MAQRTAAHVRRDVLRPIQSRGDRTMSAVCWFLWIVSLCIAPVYNTWQLWIVGATALALTATAFAFFAGGSAVSRNAIAVVFMLFAALIIHQSGGTIEAHFIIFALLSFLLFYRDFVPILVATGVTAVHHLLFCHLQMAGVPVLVFPPNHPCSMLWVHIACVLFESGVLCLLARMICAEALEAGTIAALGERMAQTGSLDLALAGAEATGTSSRALLRLLATIEDTVAQAASVAQGVSGASEDMSVAASRMISAGRAQHVTSATVVRTVEHISSATDEITANCSEVARVAHASATVVGRGRDSMARAVLLMEALAQSVSGAAEQIQDLNAASARVEGVIELIAGLADQTSLLALNASIEAARAGEYGRGFAVVAQEIRELSERTHRSLIQAQTILDSNKTGIQQLTASAGQCRQDAVRGAAQVSEANIALGDVLSELPHIAQRADSVIRIARQHGQLTGDVVAHMREIAEAVARNGEDLDRIDRLGNALRTMSANLCRNVEVFCMPPAPPTPVPVR